MNVDELAQLIEELETRVERLRSVYEQYFMGIERLEPLIMRKDVDRRLWILRREQIRNTGMRFKLQTTIQRYNTYQQYWARIVREMENGTYQRDLGRAAARFGQESVTAFGKRRQKMFQKGMAKKAERDAARQAATGAAPLSPDSDQGPPSGDSFDVAFDDSEIFTEEEKPTTKAAALELDMQFDSPPEAARPAARPLARAHLATPPRGAPAMVPPRDARTPRHGSFPPPPMPAPPAAPAAAKPAAPPPPAARAPAPLPNRPTSGGLPPVQPPPARPPAQRAPAAAPMPSAPVARSPAAAPAARSPAAAPAAKSPAAAPAATAATADGELSPTRLRQIYGQYVDAKRKVNESTAAITYDKIAANLRETAKQLKTKHGRNVDFEVVMKNGKPVLKPIVKG